MGAEKNYALANLSITIRGRQGDGYSWADGVKLLVRDYSANPNEAVYMAISSSTTTDQSDSKMVTWSNFVDVSGASVTFDATHRYMLYFVSSSTEASAISGTGITLSSQQVAAYTNGNIDTAQTATGFFNIDNSGNVTMPSTGYKPYIVISASVTEVEVEDKGTLNVYLLTGQSNSLGAVKGSPLSAEELASHSTTMDDGIYYWHENFLLSNGVVYDGYSITWEAVAPAAPATSAYSYNKCMGPEYGFAWMLKNKPALITGSCPGKPFGIIKASLDGGGNGNWESTKWGWKNIIAATEHAVTRARRDGYSKVNVVGLIYLQGESNSSDEADLAGTRITELRERLVTALPELSENITIFPDFHIAIGEPANWTHDGPDVPEASGKYTNTSRANLYAAAMAIPEGQTKTFGTWIPTRDLAKITSGDSMKVHYNGQSQLTIGARYAYAEAIRWGYVERAAIRSYDYNATLDSEAAYYAGSVPNGETITWDVSSAALSTVGAAGATLHGLKFDYDGGNYLQSGATLIRGEGTLTIGAGGINAAKNVNFTAPVRVSASQTWTLAAGVSVTFSGGLTVDDGAELSLVIGTGATLTMPVSGEMEFESISNSGTLCLTIPSATSYPRISVKNGTIDASKVTTNFNGLLFESSSDGKSVVPKREYIWMPIGDSITEGESSFETVGGYRKPMWEYFRDDGLNVRAVGYRNGHCGTVEPESQDRWSWHNGMYGGGIVPVGDEGLTHGMAHYSIETELEICGYPDVITILIGINDLSFYESTVGAETRIAEVWKNLSTYVAKVAALRPNSAVVVSTLLPNYNNVTTPIGPEFNKCMRQALEDKATPFNLSNVYLADMAKDAFNDTYNSDYFKSDNLHPNRAGGLLLGRAFADRVEEILEARKTNPAKIVAVHNEEGTEATEGTEGTQPKIHIRFSKPLASFSASTVTLTSGDNTIDVTHCAIDAEDRCLVVGSVENDEAFTTQAKWTLSVNGSATDKDGNSITSFEDFAKCDIAKSGVIAHVPNEFIDGFQQFKVYELEENANSSEIAPTRLIDGIVDDDKIITDVAFYLELKRPGKSPQFVWTSMDASVFGYNPDKMGVPTAASGTIQNFNVPNLYVYGNRGNFTKKVMGGKGIIEFTPSKYNGTDVSTGPADIRSGKLGWNDTLSASSGDYISCMQVFYVANATSPNPLTPYAETLFAYNKFASSDGDDLGIGTMVTHRSNASSLTPAYDWTDVGKGGFTKTLATTAYETRTLEVWVKTRQIGRATVDEIENGAAKAYKIGETAYTLAALKTAINNGTIIVDELIIKDQAEPCVLNDDLTAFANVTIGANVTVARSKLNASLVTLKGSGILDLGENGTLPETMDKSEWDGIIILSGTRNGTKWGSLYTGTAKSKIMLKGFKGWPLNGSGGWETQNNSNLVLENTTVGSETYGYKNGAFTSTASRPDIIATFSSSISGNGTFIGTTDGEGKTLSFIFSGDLSGYTGKMTSDQTLNSNYYNSLTFGAGTEAANAAIEIGAFSIDWGNTIRGSASAVTFNYGAADVVFPGVISTAVLKKEGTGSLKLTGENTYSGATTVSAGTLIVGSASALGTSPVTVQSGATLDVAIDAVNETKLIGGSFTLADGATVKYKGQTVAVERNDDGIYLTSKIVEPETKTEHSATEAVALVVSGVAAENETAAESAVVVVPPSIGLTTEEITAYSGYFTKTAAQDGNNWSVTVELNKDAVAPAIAADSEEGEALLADQLSKIAAAEDDEEIEVRVGDVKPGLYYTLEADRDLKSLKPRVCEQAKSGAKTVSLELPKEVKGGTSCFYHIRVTPWKVAVEK